MEKLDCRGQQCPQPVVQTRKAMLTQPAKPLQVLVDDYAARDNISRLAKSLGYTVNFEQKDNTFVLNLTPGDAPVKSSSMASNPGPTIIFIASDQIGQGDPELGRILMKNFIFTLTESDTTPDAIYFVNNGVKLTIGGSGIIEPLEELADRGVDIASCGLCLDFFEAKASLIVGRVSNMLDLVNDLLGAWKIIRL